ncbi:DUF6138 family protein [Lysinibacillus piscis]|uniref:DUF6138 family protein n=1 Tax=Lysinibacillus piscis TaxID=2518931 RepID=UPI0022316774|nr:DUF6138 family protein [Lysinibacillus sp. KH24]
MSQYIERFLADVWQQLEHFYLQENDRMSTLNDWSQLHIGVNHYVKVKWTSKKLDKLQWGTPHYGTISIYTYEPFSWHDDAYKVAAGDYMQDITEHQHIEALFSALCTKMDRVFQSADYHTKLFDYRLQVILEFEHEGRELYYQKELLNHNKLALAKQTLATFIETKVMADLPVRPAEKDGFFFARYLVNPHFFQQRVTEIEPLIQRLLEKYRGNEERFNQWMYDYTLAFKDWAEEHILAVYFERTGEYTTKWILNSEARPNQEELEFFVYIALQMGDKEPDTRQQYLAFAQQLGSQEAIHYLQNGSGRCEPTRKSVRFQGKANDILKSIAIQINVEEEEAYREALQYIIDLLQTGFVKGYHLQLKSQEENYLSVKELAQSELHQFFANCLTYPNLFPLLADYAQLAMEAYAWYEDVEPSEQSVMPGTYAIFGLGLYSDAYFPLVQTYMSLVDSEHQLVQNYYAEAFLDRHGLSVEVLPVLIDILLSANEGELEPLKGISLDEPVLLAELIHHLESKEDYQREYVLYQIFGSVEELTQRIEQEVEPMKEMLEKLLGWMAEWSY